MMINAVNANCFLSSLLPYSTEDKSGGELQKGLSEYQLLLKASSCALEALCCYRGEAFDALVGENACQIRAVRIALLLHSLLNEKGQTAPYRDLANRTLSIWQEIESLKESKELKRGMKKRLVLSELLREKKWDISLTKEQCFAVESFLLTQTKAVKGRKEESPLLSEERADPKRLQVFGSSAITAKFLSNLESGLRQKLAKDSVDFLLQKIVPSFSNFARKEEVQTLLSSQYVFNHKKNWPTLPMFWSYEGLMDFALKEGLFLQFTVKLMALDEKASPFLVDQASLAFKPCLESCRYLPVEESLAEGKVALKIEGVSLHSACKALAAVEWKEKMEKMDPVEIILANAAAHRQYPEETQDAELPKTAHWKAFWEKGQEWGCSLENPQLFMIQHVLCSIIKKAS